MNPSPEAVAKIRERVASAPGWAADDADILAGLNAPAIPNPAPRPLVRRPLTVDAAMALVAPENRAKVYARPAVVAFRDDVTRGDLVGAVNWLRLAADAGDLAESEFDAIVAAATATVPDPSWPPQISWAEAEIGRALDIQDIRESRP